MTIATMMMHPKLLRRESNESRTSSSSYGSTISKNPFSFKLNSGPATLQEIIAEREWDRAIQLLNVKGRLAKKKFIVPSFLHEWKGAAEIYPIHQACASPSVPLELLDSLLFAYPQGIEKKESIMLRNCLHIALRACVREDVIEYLLHRYPALVYEHDSQGRIPLHYACSNGCSVDLIRKMIDICPDSVRAPDKRGWTPLHVIVSKVSDPEIARYMVSICPEAVTAKTSVGSTPIKIAQMCHSATSELYFSIIQNAEIEVFRSPSFKNYRKSVVKTTNINECYV